MPDNRTADDIIREMRQIRRELRADVAGIVDQAQGIADRAQDLTDWRYYVRNYPLVCLGAAIVAGYFLVPTRVKYVAPPTPAKHDPSPKAEAKQSSVTGALLATAGSVVTSLVMQAVSNYARQHLNQFLDATLQGAYPTSAPEAHASNGKHSPAHSNGGNN